MIDLSGFPGTTAEEIANPRSLQVSHLFYGSVWKFFDIKKLTNTDVICEMNLL